MLTKKIEKLLQTNGHSFNATQVKQLEQLMLLVLDKNKQFNLTAITEENDFLVKHILDSLAAINHLKQNARVLDIGSGAGFPSLVLKIARPDLEFVLVDSIKKKTDFLNYSINELKLTRILAVHTRIEDFAKQNLESFDHCTSRAVAPLSVLMEYSLPFLKNDATMIAYKGPSVVDELNFVENSLKILGGNIQNIIELDIEGQKRTLVIVKKIKVGQKGYPRSGNKPRISPLN
jgi:16S rRNA (guanine527-N7)-methyltransferase